MPAVWSSPVVWTVAISCWLKVQVPGGIGPHAIIIILPCARARRSRDVARA
jgi:hypothetical protein